MTDLLDRRIRTLMTHVADASPEAPSTDQIETRRDAHRRPSRDGATPSELLLERRPARAAGLGGGLRHRRPAWVAVAAAMVVIVAVGGVAWLLTRSQESVPPVLSQPESNTSLPVPTTTPEGTSLPVPTTTPVGTVAGPVMSWQQVPSQASLGAGDAEHEYVMHAVITGGPGLIAGGQVRPVSDSDFYFNWPTTGTEATIWTSEDGITWDRISSEVSGLDGPGGYMIHDLAIGGPGYIAVGAALEDGQVHAAVWVSADGLSWDRVESPSFLEEAMFAVAAGDSGIVAVWGDVWYSSDGFVWQRVETPAGFSALGTGSAWDVAHADWGYVAVGTKSGEPENTQKPYAWISQDGLDWERVDLHPTEEWVGAEVWSVLARGNEVVVAGSLAQTYNSYFDAPPVFWTTSDGSLWSEHALDSVPVPGMTKPEALIEGLAETDSGVVAVGSWVHRPKAPGDEGWARAAVWATSTGNSTWTEVSGGDTFGEGSWMWDVTVLDGVLFGVGDYAGEAAVWIGEWID